LIATQFTTIKSKMGSKCAKIRKFFSFKWLQKIERMFINRNAAHPPEKTGFYQSRLIGRIVRLAVIAFSAEPYACWRIATHKSLLL
jgi:hypothetical protein